MGVAVDEDLEVVCCWAVVAGGRAGVVRGGAEAVGGRIVGAVVGGGAGLVGGGAVVGGGMVVGSTGCSINNATNKKIKMKYSINLLL